MAGETETGSEFQSLTVRIIKVEENCLVQVDGITNLRVVIGWRWVERISWRDRVVYDEVELKNLFC